MKKLRFLLGTLFVLCVLSIVPASSAQAATVGTLNPLNHWISTSSGYSVMLKTNGKLYYKYNGKTVGISQNVHAAAVNGTQIAYIKEAANSDYGELPYIVLYDLKTKKSRSYHDLEYASMEVRSIALYNGYIYFSFFDSDCGSFHIGCLRTSTMKTASNSCYKCLIANNSYYSNAFYQNGQYLICQEGKAVEGTGGHLRILNMKTGKFTKTLSSKCGGFAVVGSTIYFIDVTPSTSETNCYDKYTIRSSSLSGTSLKTYMTFKDTATYGEYGFAFHGGKVIVEDCNQKTYKYRYRDFTLSTGKYTNTTEANYNYMVTAYFHCDEPYMEQY